MRTKTQGPPARIGRDSLGGMVGFGRTTGWGHHSPASLFLGQTKELPSLFPPPRGATVRINIAHQGTCLLQSSQGMAHASTDLPEVQWRACESGHDLACDARHRWRGQIAPARMGLSVAFLSAPMASASRCGGDPPSSEVEIRRRQALCTSNPKSLRLVTRQDRAGNGVILLRGVRQRDCSPLQALVSLLGRGKCLRRLDLLEKECPAVNTVVVARQIAGVAPF